MSKEISKQFLQDKIKELKEQIDALKADKFQAQEVFVISFFENITDNIAIWASRGHVDDFEVVYWNNGAENIYGYKREEAIGKNVVDLIMTSEFIADAKSDCELIINEGASFKNMIASDQNKYGRPITVITNTFRIPDFEREGQYLQAEIGIDITSMSKQLKDFRTVEEVDDQIGVLEHIGQVVKVINKKAQDQSALIEMLKYIVKSSKVIFGNQLFSFFSIVHQDQKLLVPKSARTRKHESDVINRISRMGWKKPFFKRQADPIAVTMPIFHYGSDEFLGVMYMEFPTNYEWSEEKYKAVQTFVQQVDFAVKYKLLAIMNKNLLSNLDS